LAEANDESGGSVGIVRIMWPGRRPAVFRFGVLRRPPTLRVGLALALLLLLAGCGGGGYTWAWYILIPTTAEGRINLFYMLRGFELTVILAALSFTFGSAIGLFLAILRRSHSRGLRVFVATYISVVRAIPTFVLLLWIYYALPVLVQSLPSEIQNLPGIYELTHLTPLSAATLTLALSAGAFMSEIFRAGIEGVPRGHMEAALSLGMSRAQMMRRIVLPQATRRMLPPTASQFIQTIKDSALASTIGLQELTRRASELQVQTYRPLEIYTLLALEYLVVVLALSYVAHVIERRTQID